MTSRFLPSVAFLIHQHSIPESAIATIVGSGPKNHILKGDILAFLSGFSIAHSTPETESIYSIDINTSSLASFGLPINDLISTAVLKKMELLNVSPVCSLVRESRVGDLNVNIDGTGITASILSKLKTTDKKPVFKIVDSLALGVRYETPDYHLEGKEAVISINQISVPEESADIIDFLGDYSGKSSPVKPESSDLFATKEIRGNIRIELTVDEKLGAKKAQAFLAKVKELIELKPQELLK
ncbi:hypothetical protein HK103_007404 [Boothiomyces macroporosus]|uniref:Peripheral subunit-binding (PSBD) domain-containing protein n=1 Tax=Boothiomyces macroporosus TaxID=261099 RepID=A0AAD5Y7Q3_9FUNG|nr:hypothetical protein HK103_007404 [Boothiomyces macroporosus]